MWFVFQFTDLSLETDELAKRSDPGDHQALSVPSTWPSAEKRGVHLQLYGLVGDVRGIPAIVESGISQQGQRKGFWRLRLRSCPKSLEDARDVNHDEYLELYVKMVVCCYYCFHEITWNEGRTSWDILCDFMQDLSDRNERNTLTAVRY